MGTLIITDAPSTGENLEYVDMLTNPVLDGLAFRLNPYTNTESYLEPNGKYSASLLEDMKTKTWEALGRNEAMSGGIIGGGIIADDTINGRPYLLMESLATDANQKGRWYLIPNTGRDLLKSNKGFSIFWVGSVKQPTSGNTSRLVTAGKQVVVGTNDDSYLELIVNASRIPSIRISYNGEAYTSASSATAINWDEVYLFSIHYNAETGSLSLKVNGTQYASATLSTVGSSAWNNINSFRIASAAISGNITVGARGKFADFLVYNKVLDSGDITSIEGYLKNLYSL